MATKYEYYDSGDDGQLPIFSQYWRAQTFTPQSTHTITSVKLLLYRVGSPGTLTVGIRATDGSGHPTGADLCSGTTDGDTLPTGSPYEWREITLGAGYSLSASTKYAIVARISGGTINSNDIQWRYDGTSPTYSGGNYETSSDSGSTWTANSTRDLMFEEWGDPPPLQTISPSGIASAEAFGTPYVHKVISPSGIASAEAFGTAIVALTYDLKIATKLRDYYQVGEDLRDYYTIEVKLR